MTANPATGKRIEFRDVRLVRFEHGLIAYERFVYDFSGVLIKLGVVKARSWMVRVPVS